MSDGGVLRFDGRVAVVTGAGGGLGREYARLLASRGASVVVNDLGGDTHGAPGTPAVAEAAAAELRAAGGAAVANGDTVATPEGAAAIVRTALDAFGRLDVVINNAGISTGGAFEATEPDVYELLWRVHFLGHVNVTRAAWATMLEQGYGRVVNVTSGSVFGFAGSGPYACAKAAVLGLTRTLAAESRGSGILVNAIMPVAFTRMTAQIPDDRFRGWLETHTPPSLVAPAACFLAHEDCSTTGEIWSAGGGRVARVFLGQALGYTSADLTLEDVRGHLEEIRATDGALVFADAMEEVRHYMQVLRGDE